MKLHFIFFSHSAETQRKENKTPFAFFLAMDAFQADRAFQSSRRSQERDVPCWHMFAQVRGIMPLTPALSGGFFRHPPHVKGTLHCRAV